MAMTFFFHFFPSSSYSLSMLDGSVTNFATTCLTFRRGFLYCFFLFCFMIRRHIYRILIQSCVEGLRKERFCDLKMGGYCCADLGQKVVLYCLLFAKSADVEIQVYLPNFVSSFGLS